MFTTENLSNQWLVEILVGGRNVIRASKFPSAESVGRTNVSSHETTAKRTTFGFDCVCNREKAQEKPQERIEQNVCCNYILP